MSRSSFDYCHIISHDDLVVDLIIFPVHFSSYQSLSTTSSVQQKLSSRLKFRLFLHKTCCTSTKHVAPRSSRKTCCTSIEPFPKTSRLRPLKKEGERKSASERETERAHERENERSASETLSEREKETNPHYWHRRGGTGGEGTRRWGVGGKERDLWQGE